MKKAPGNLLKILFGARSPILLGGLIFLQICFTEVCAADSPSVSIPVSEVHIPVVISGGHETDPRDHGRPVILIASALGVPPEVFRQAFSHVRPAPAGEQPDPGQVRTNKAALMNALAPYGVTNERLDEVSNYYRYRPENGELWQHVPAEAYATVREGVITSFTITNPGAGYSSAPTVTVPGMVPVKMFVQFSMSNDLSKNGGLKALELGSFMESGPAR